MNSSGQATDEKNLRLDDPSPLTVHARLPLVGVARIGNSYARVKATIDVMSDGTPVIVHIDVSERRASLAEALDPMVLRASLAKALQRLENPLEVQS